MTRGFVYELMNPQFDDSNDSGFKVEKGKGNPPLEVIIGQKQRKKDFHESKSRTVSSWVDCSAMGSGAAAYVLDLFSLDGEGRRVALGELAAVLADPSVSKAGHNLKLDLKFLRAALAESAGLPRWPGKRFKAERLFDTMLASQLATAGDFIPADQFPRWREENGVREVEEGNGPPCYFDRHGHELHFERDTRRAIWPVYLTTWRR